MKYLIALLALCAAFAANAREDLPPGDVDAGREYAKRVCSDCHRVEASKGGAAKAPKQMDFDMLAQTKGMSAVSLNAFLLTPHPTMPNLIIPPEDRRNVIAYILSLRVR